MSGLASPSNDTDAIQLVLHTGCGPRGKKDLPGGFKTVAWKELRLDLDPAVEPDFVGSIVDMSTISSSSMNAVYSSHVIEHLFRHEVPSALREFHRVLKADGFAVITCPDIQGTAELIASGKLHDPLPFFVGLPVTPHDILYGLGSAIARGNHFMAHRCGFTVASWLDTLSTSGFARAFVGRTNLLTLWALATKAPVDDEELEWLKQTFFPAHVPQL